MSDKYVERLYARLDSLELAMEAADRNIMHIKSTAAAKNRELTKSEQRRVDMLTRAFRDYSEEHHEIGLKLLYLGYDVEL